MTLESRAADAGAAAQNNARRASETPLMRTLARAGLCARGAVYVVISALAAQVALGRQSSSADQKGALQQVSNQPFGRVALILLAAGFAGYAAWRVVTVVTGEAGHGGDAGLKQAARRVAAAGQGAVYIVLCISTIAVLEGSGESGSSAERPAAPTSRLLALPAGRLLVVAVGIGVMVAGAGLAWWALREKFEEHLTMGEMGAAMRRPVIALGVAGYVSRGVVVVLVGGALVKAAADYDAAKAEGFDDALRSLAGHAYGTTLLLFTALGLLAFGLFSFAEARYRKL